MWTLSSHYVCVGLKVGAFKLSASIVELSFSLKEKIERVNVIIHLKPIFIVVLLFILQNNSSAIAKIKKMKLKSCLVIL